MPCLRCWTHQVAVIVFKGALVNFLGSRGAYHVNLTQMVLDRLAAHPDNQCVQRETLRFLEQLLDELGSRVAEKHVLSKILRAAKILKSVDLYRTAMCCVRSAFRIESSLSYYMAKDNVSPTTAIAFGVAGIINEFHLDPTLQDWNDY